ncbi:hypothetical protein P4E94_05720 [Pontiellaceae bacterium B12219]|nr:hypothetical protein [Pontiellaceae bacterium B12219]
MNTKQMMQWTLVVLFGAGSALAQEKAPVSYADETRDERATDLAKRLANPIANLISLPLQYNYDENYGANDKGSKSQLNIQPVAPFSISENWNVITRTIVPLIDLNDMPGVGDKSGLGDITASQFFSPKAPTKNGWVWGAGPVELIPTASDDALGGGKFGLGPTAVVLKQSGPWTIGGLVNQVWSIGGPSDREDINSMFIQPFAAYIVEKTKTTLSLNTESSYDWENEQWSVPINVGVAQLFKVGPQIMQLQLGARYWVESPTGGPEDWGLRCQLTFLFPK